MPSPLTYLVGVGGSVRWECLSDLAWQVRFRPSDHKILKFIELYQRWYVHHPELVHANRGDSVFAARITVEAHLEVGLRKSCVDGGKYERRTKETTLDGLYSYRSLSARHGQ